MTVFSLRTLLAMSLYEIDPDGADSEGVNLGNLPTALGSSHAMAAFDFSPEIPTQTVEVTFQGSAGSLSLAVTKTGAATKPVEVTFQGSAGSLSLAVTKTGAATKPVEVTFQGSAGSFSLAVTKTAISDKPVEVTFQGSAGSLSLAVTKTAISDKPVEPSLSKVRRVPFR